MGSGRDGDASARVRAGNVVDSCFCSTYCVRFSCRFAPDVADVLSLCSRPSFALAPSECELFACQGQATAVTLWGSWASSKVKGAQSVCGLIVASRLQASTSMQQSAADSCRE